MLLEDFKGCLSDNVVHLNEQKVSSLAEAAVLVDEFVLSHKVVSLMRFGTRRLQMLPCRGNMLLML